VPPMVSALKVGGQRLHRLARRGEVVEREPRRITVHSWEWLGFELPEASFRVVVSGGTYVRTLAHDLGARLGPGGALKSLRRLRSEPFGLEGAVGLCDLDSSTPEEVFARAGVPLAEALRVLPLVALDAAGAAELGFGRRPTVEAGEAPLRAGRRSVAFCGPGGEPLALGELEPDPARPGAALACPHVVFPWAVRQGRP
jgi:tRNA pseudouridine55 synthase